MCVQKSVHEVMENGTTRSERTSSSSSNCCYQRHATHMPSHIEVCCIFSSVSGLQKLLSSIFRQSAFELTRFTHNPYTVHIQSTNSRELITDHYPTVQWTSRRFELYVANYI